MVTTLLVAAVIAVADPTPCKQIVTVVDGHVVVCTVCEFDGMVSITCD